MRIVLVAMANSIHTARWVAQLPVDAWDVHVFSSTPSGESHPNLKGVTVHHLCHMRAGPGVQQRGIPVIGRRVAPLAETALDRIVPSLRARLLVRAIRKLRPDVVHSLEIQHGGYLALRARQILGDAFPTWLVTNWGNDIYHFGNDPAHAERIREVLRLCNAYSCECARDERLALEWGFTGRSFPPSPNTGGFDLERIGRMRRGPPSTRRLIMLKGYQGWAGRALVVLRALEEVGPQLNGYRLCVYSASPEVANAASILSGRVGIPVEIFTYRDHMPHEEMLRRHGEARVSIGASVTDGVSTSFLEALVMGSFPVQSWTSCANEWIVDGETGILISPEDPGEIAAAIRRALEDDALVDTAAARNWVTAKERLDGEQLARKAREMYEQLAPRG